MTTELENKIGEVAAELEKAGLEKVRSGWGPDGYGFSFTDRSKVRRTYLGTYLNPFSVGNPSEHQLWSDEWVVERPDVRVGAVYRHNGTADDKGVAVTFIGFHATITPFPAKWDFEKSKPEYVRLVREGSPFFYIEEKKPVSVCTSGQEVRIAKLGLKAGRKAIANAVAKVLAACGEYEPLDHSQYAKDQKDYHWDTTVNYRKWQDAERVRQGVAI